MNSKFGLIVVLFLLIASTVFATSALPQSIQSLEDQPITVNFSDPKPVTSEASLAFERIYEGQKEINQRMAQRITALENENKELKFQVQTLQAEIKSCNGYLNGYKKRLDKTDEKIEELQFYAEELDWTYGPLAFILFVFWGWHIYFHKE